MKEKSAQGGLERAQTTVFYPKQRRTASVDRVSMDRARSDPDTSRLSVYSTASTLSEIIPRRNLRTPGQRPISLISNSRRLSRDRSFADRTQEDEDMNLLVSKSSNPLSRRVSILNVVTSPDLGEDLTAVILPSRGVSFASRRLSTMSVGSGTTRTNTAGMSRPGTQDTAGTSSASDSSATACSHIVGKRHRPLKDQETLKYERITKSLIEMFDHIHTTTQNRAELITKLESLKQRNAANKKKLDMLYNKIKQVESSFNAYDLKVDSDCTSIMICMCLIKSI